MAKINVITLGESGVGKTSFLFRFKTGKFKESTRSTFVDHYSKTITVENIKTDAVIWDTAGQERYNSLIKKYYAMADGVLLMYDVNDAITFSKLSRWLSDVRKENETAEIIIVGNKNEDATLKKVCDSDVQDFVEKENLQHIEASSKTGQNVDLVFQLLTKKILTTRGTLPPTPNKQHISEDILDSKSSSKSSSVKNEPEINFSYYGKSEQSEITVDEKSALQAAEEDKTSKKCFQCRIG